MDEGKVIDIRVNLVGTGDSGSGCLLSGDFASGPAFASMLESVQVAPFEESDRGIEERILDFVSAAEKIDRCVILSLDGVYKNSRLVIPETSMMTPNAYVAGIAANNSRLLFGASVHPYRDRKEMLNETDRCLAEGAVLFNWIPCVQQIDPEDDRCIPFYVRLVRENAPLLCHTGPDFYGLHGNMKAIGCGSPKRLIKALEIGVKIIVAHCGTARPSAAAPGSEHSYELVEMLMLAEERKWNLYADVSCFCDAEGMLLLERIKSEVDKGNIGVERLLYGSGFPASSVVRPALVPACKERLQHMDSINPLDECYAAARDLCIPDSAFTNALNVLRL